ncbi:TIGR03086 family metal-binding protein [Blastococcus sp. SYSU D00820]
MRTTTAALAAASGETARVVAGIRDDQLSTPTPCTDLPVAGLLDHLVGLTLAFRDAARKRAQGSAPVASADALAPDWRTRIPAQLEALVAAWTDDAAWEGSTEVGGVTMPAPEIAAVGVDEVLVHGWDLAVATGQRYRPDPAAVEIATGLVRGLVAAGPVPGLFGPSVPVGDDGAPFDRLLAMTGRDPSWRAALTRP